ncbi:BmGPI3, B microti specific [Babesia microti strain RI]|uniref:BmGPI3, B microti specific n=1 Tax=Babesia microti (strain RI) TaxID=1133968 RepID=I7J555_BABMR|nr:BmGPI3, B microti specific [Babesia microti strain RI]CCF72557.1 BmGPI3, B microti specific [Babesia microti strain RI]|eukprot:XP_012647166.1 BmGPI3, B microti specific [Babesia microti strain RI]
MPLKYLLVCLALVNTGLGAVITPPNVGDADLKDLATPDESETNESLPDQTDPNANTATSTNDTDEPQTGGILSMLEMGRVNDGEKQKIEITPKARETSYEVKVTNIMKKDTSTITPQETDSPNKPRPSGNLRRIISETLAEQSLDAENKPNKDAPKEETRNKPEKEAVIAPVDPTAMNILEPEQIDNPTTQLGADGKTPPALFEDDPPIDVIVDHNLEFGLINVFPLSKLYSAYLHGVTRHKDFFDLPPDTAGDEVSSHPYNGKILEALNALVDQIKFNHDRINKMNNELIISQRDITSVSKSIKFTPSNHKLLEALTTRSKKTYDQWKDSFEFTQNKLITTRESLENVKQCITGGSMHKCRKHFETVFDLLNLFDIFSRGTNLCNYASICQINLRRKVTKFLHFTEIQLRYDAANKDIQKMAEFVNQLKRESHSALAAVVTRTKKSAYGVVGHVNNSIKNATVNDIKNSSAIGAVKVTNSTHNKPTGNVYTDTSNALFDKLEKMDKDSVNLRSLSNFCAFTVMLIAIAF